MCVFILLNWVGYFTLLIEKAEDKVSIKILSSLNDYGLKANL